MSEANSMERKVKPWSEVLRHGVDEFSRQQLRATMRVDAYAQMLPEIYRHKKTGGIYGVLCNATRESDGVLLVVYRNLDTGERWARPADEFNDGRFERVA